VKRAATLVALAALLAGAVHVRSAQACILFCKQRHPVHSWEVRHHVRRCDAKCKARRAAHNRSSHRPRVKQAYPCVVRWTYPAKSGVRWWHLTYGPGRYGRNHVGLGPHSYRRCL
jgi:hypothetical protein